MNLTEVYKPKKPQKAVVFAFGRFQPPTIAHAMLIDKVKQIAEARNAEARIYTSQSNDENSNPLSFKVKTDFMRKMFGSVVQNDTGIRTIFEVFDLFERQGFTDVTMVAGSDRVPDFKKTFSKYIKGPKAKDHNPDTDYNFVFDVASAGERDPDADGMSGVSGTKMRQAAADGDFNTFKKGVPTSNNTLAKQLFDAVRKGMGLKSMDKKNIRESYKIGDIVEDYYGQVGRVTSIRKSQVAYNILETGAFAAADFDKLTILENKSGINSNMNAETKAKLKHLSETKSIPFQLLEQRYNRAILHEYDPKVEINPQISAMKAVSTFAENYVPKGPDVDKIYEAAYMTPADGVGPTYDGALGGDGNVSSGLGPGAGSSLLMNDKKLKPKTKDKKAEIKEWINNPKTVKMFFDRYGDKAQEKLEEAGNRLYEETKSNRFSEIKNNLKSKVHNNE